MAAPAYTDAGIGDRRLLAFLGGTIGNLEPPQRAMFLARVRAALQPGEHLLLGAALVTDPAVLVAAYDDMAGVTAEFNRNVLNVLNRELHADLDVDAFAHSRSGTPSGSGSRCGCARCVRWR